MLSSQPLIFASTMPEGGAFAATGGGTDSDAGGASVSVAVARCGLGVAVSLSGSVPVSSCWALAAVANKPIEQTANAKAVDRRAALLAFITRSPLSSTVGIALVDELLQ